MSLFRSRLFRWLAQLWPVQWGRQARQQLQRPIRQIGTWITAHLQPAIAPVWEATRQHGLPEAPPPLLWLEGVPAEPPAPQSPRRLGAGVPLRLIRVGRASWQRLRAGALAPPTATLDRRVPRKSFAEILAEAIAYYFGRAKPALPSAPEGPGDRGDAPALVPEAGVPMAAVSSAREANEPPLTVPTLETRAVFLGYAYGPLVEFLLWLDRWVERIENFCLRLWRWLCRA